MSYIGVDLHQNSITVCRRTGDGSEAFETLTLSPADMERFCLSLDADDEVAIEATGNSAWFRDQSHDLHRTGAFLVQLPYERRAYCRQSSQSDPWNR